MAVNPQEKEFFKKHFTIKGRVLYPNLLKPVLNKNGTRSVYNCQFIWSDSDPTNNAVMQEMQAFIALAKSTFSPQIPDQFYVNPIKHFNTYMRQDGRPNPEYLKGHYWVNAATGADIPPSVIGPDQSKLMAGVHDAEAYSGRNAVINISFYRISKEKHGLSVNVNGVMLLNGGDQIVGEGSFNAQEIFGNFAQQMGLPQGAPPAAPAQNNWGAPPAPSAPANNGVGGYGAPPANGGQYAPPAPPAAPEHSNVHGGQYAPPAPPTAPQGSFPPAPPAPTNTAPNWQAGYNTAAPQAPAPTSHPTPPAPGQWGGHQ